MKTVFSFLMFAAALSSTGCVISEQPRAHVTPFVPPPPRSGYSATLADPAPQVNPSVGAREGVSLLQAPAVLPRWTVGDSMVQRAQSSFDTGKKLYQSEDYSGARREFDEAIDQMVEASDLEPADRQDYQRRLDDMVESVHRLDSAGMGTPQDDNKFEKAPLEDILQLTFPVDPKLKNKVREQAAATVSQLPLVVNDTVLGYINYFSSNRGRGTLVFATERSGRYRPMIQRILDEEGVPQELIHLAQAESGFAPRAQSSMAAVGMWQFIAMRGQQYGLTRNQYFDDRMDPEKATRAAARHLHDLYNEFGDWYLAIAAYNCGPLVVEDAVARTGFADFWELRSRGVLPAETTNYVPIILAMTIIEKNGAEYGLNNIQMDSPLQYDTVDLSATTNLALVSDLTDTPLPQLVDLNPALLHGVAPEGYALHVPKGTGNQLFSGLEQVPAERRSAWRVHRMEAGDTLATISRRFGVMPAAIMAANNLKTAEAPEGDRLLIPAAMRVDAPARKPLVSTATRRTPAAGVAQQRHTTASTATAKAPQARTAAHPVTAAAKPQAKTAAGVAKPQAKPVVGVAKPQSRPGTASVTSSAPPAVILPRAGK